MEEEGEIEYLEEDEDLIQQYVQNVQIAVTESAQSSVQNYPAVTADLEDHIAPLLVERRPTEIKRKIKTEDDDSDYDPSVDIHPQRKKKKIRSAPVKVIRSAYFNKKTTPKNVTPSPYEEKLKSLPNLVVKKQLVTKSNTNVTKQVKRVSYNDIKERKKLDIRIPDYEDPICLPVKAVKRDEYDVKRLKYWNKLCLDWYRKADTPLRPTRGETVGSVRTLVLKNVRDRKTGKIDTTIFGKIMIENEQGEIKSETYQSVLPKYREKKVLASYPLLVGERRDTKHVFEAVICKEKNKDEESLVVYKPKESVSAVYKYIEKTTQDDEHPHRDRNVLKEVTCCKICAPCYQASWRGVVKKNDEKTDNINCPVCKRLFVSVYNLLTHVKNGHTNQEVRKYKKEIAKKLATVVDYHYKCRICQEMFTSIKSLRSHVSSKHQGAEVFKCEIGNHMAS